MNILFYTVANKRSRDIESQAVEFAKERHGIFLFTQSPSSELHDFFESKGFFSASSAPSKRIFPIFLVQEIFKLVRFCKRHKIAIVHSHLDPCNLVAVCCQYFTNTKIIVNRHHADALVYEASKRTQLISRWIYKKAQQIVVVSANVKRYMVETEKINPRKITVVPLSFDFNLYSIPIEEQIEELRERYDADILLCTVGRLTGLKRIDSGIRLAHQLSKLGLDVKLLILGQGQGAGELEKLVEELEIFDRVFFLGFINEVLPYIAISDYYIHLSITEASCTTVKEAGLVGTPVIVCNNVGDFNEYLINEKNGFLVNKVNPVEDAVNIITKTYQDRKLLSEIGSRLKSTILRQFDIKNVMPLYHSLHQKVLKD